MKTLKRIITFYPEHSRWICVCRFEKFGHDVEAGAKSGVLCTGGLEINHRSMSLLTELTKFSYPPSYYNPLLWS